MVPSGLIWIDLGRVYTACWIEPIHSVSIQKPSANLQAVTEGVVQSCAVLNELLISRCVRVKPLTRFVQLMKRIAMKTILFCMEMPLLFWE